MKTNSNKEHYRTAKLHPDIVVFMTGFHTVGKCSSRIMNRAFSDVTFNPTD